MAYVNRDFKTKKELIAAVKAGEAVYVERNMFGQPDTFANGTKAAIEGPKYRVHSWYVDATVDPETQRVIKAK
jgi:hypothetical protein